MRLLSFLQEEGEEWVILHHPPLYDPDASKQQEQQRVQVDFKSAQDEPDAHQFIIRREEIGSLELLGSFTPDSEEKRVGLWSWDTWLENLFEVPLYIIVGLIQ